MNDAADPLEEVLGGLRPCPGLQEDLARARFDEAMFGPTAPPRLGRYTLLERIGTGAMGSVYAARDPELGREVAIKVLHADARQRHDARREAQALAKLAHPNIVPVYDVGLEDGTLYIVMERLRGQTLATWLRTGPNTSAEILRAFAAAGRGLAAAHAAGLVHRDFKPTNVMVDDEGDVRVLDFGLAVEPRTQPKAAGTPGYMPPEQWRGEPLDARADQFAFCVAAAEALGDHVPASLERALARGRSADREDRFASMEPIVAALAEADAPQTRRRWGLLAVLPVAALGFAIARGQRPRPHALGSNEAMQELASAAEASAAIEAAARSLQAGDPRAARAALERSLELGRDDATQARASVQLVSVVGYHLHDTEAGLAYARSAEALLLRHPQWTDLRASLRLHLANLEYARGDLDTAVAHLQASLQLREDAARRGEQVDLVPVLNNLGVLMTELDRPDEAIDAHLRALERLGESASDPVARAGAMLNLGRAQRAAGRLCEAAATLERARRTLSDSEDPDVAAHPRLGFTLVALAQVQREASRPEDAQAAATEALSVLRAAYGEQHPQPALARLELARALHMQGEHDAARAHGERAIAALERTLGLEDANTRRAQAWLETLP